MNINDIPTTMLQRGAVISIIERDRPVVESYGHKDGTVTMVFLHGLPIPFMIFMLFMAIRFAPRRSMASMPKFYDGEKYRMPDDWALALETLWGSVQLPEDLRLWSAGMNPTSILDKVVNDLYLRHTTGELEDACASFKQLIRKIDEDYEASLIDLVQI
jgi:hypothetical protein